MNPRKLVIPVRLALIAALLFAAGCGAPFNTSTPTLLTATVSPSPAAPPTGTVPPSPAAPLRLVVFYTSDEHGWMLGQAEGRGAAGLSGLWDAQPFVAGAEVLALSGGDNWTGPAISTWFDGQSMVEVMNAMGYDAAALGNHEFDFGQETLRQRTTESSFPYLSANIRRTADDSYPADLGVQPYALLETGSLKVGVIGLTTQATAYQADPKKLEGLAFIDYDIALRQALPDVQAAGADLVIVLAHACPDEIARLALQMRNQGIALFTAGHCHLSEASKIAGTVVLSPGAYLNDFAYAVFTLNPQTKDILDVQYGVKPNRGGQPDPQVAEIIAGWKVKTDAELSTLIGYLERSLRRGSLEQQALVVESWLAGYPTADVALTNLGGLRADLPAGNLTLAEIINMMPFDNTLVAVQLSGAQLLRVLNSGKSLAVGGARRGAGSWVLERTGQRLDAGAVYTVLVNDFMYAGGDQFSMLAEFDPNGYFTGIDWRQPVIDWITAQRSAPENPLDAMLATLVE